VPGGTVEISAVFRSDPEIVEEDGIERCAEQECQKEAYAPHGNPGSRRPFLIQGCSRGERCGGEIAFDDSKLPITLHALTGSQGDRGVAFHASIHIAKHPSILHRSTGTYPRRRPIVPSTLWVRAKSPARTSVIVHSAPETHSLYYNSTWLDSETLISFAAIKNRDLVPTFEDPGYRFWRINLDRNNLNT
jgi:hypothetical protein